MVDSASEFPQRKIRVHQAELGRRTIWDLQYVAYLWITDFGDTQTVPRKTRPDIRGRHRILKITGYLK